MKKSLTLLVFATFIFSIGLVVALWALSEDIRERPGSFLRQYPPHPVIESRKIRLAKDHYYFAGTTSEKIYLANTKWPLEVLTMSSIMTDTTLVKVNLGISKSLKFFRITLKVDSPHFYFMDGVIPYIYRGNITNWRGAQIMTDSTYFVDAIPISSQSFAITALSSMTNEKVLGKLVINKDVQLNYKALQRQQDGVFDVDGSFSFNHLSNKLIYLYYYRNQFMVLDSNLNLEYRGNTIDTFKTAQIKTAAVPSENAIKLAAPPIITNKSHAVYRQWLFVHSLLPAKNENMKQFSQASTVDVYELSSGAYQFSFHVYDEDGEKMRDIATTHEKLYALFDHSVRSFDFVEKYFPRSLDAH